MRETYLDYLENHKDLEFIKQDALREFGTDYLYRLSTEDLETLAYWWDFEETKTPC